MGDLPVGSFVQLLTPAISSMANPSLAICLPTLTLSSRFKTYPADNFDHGLLHLREAMVLIFHLTIGTLIDFDQT